MKQEEKQKKQYNWFRNDSKTLQNANRKEKIKKIWRWISIFGLILLLGFSLEGCIQGMILKNGGVYDGLIQAPYSNELSPGSKTFMIEKKQNGASFIYKISKEEKHLAFADPNHGTDLEKDSDKFYIDSVWKEVDRQQPGVKPGNREAVESLSVRINKESDFLVDANGIPFVISSQSTISPTANGNGDIYTSHDWYKKTILKDLSIKPFKAAQLDDIYKIENNKTIKVSWMDSIPFAFRGIGTKNPKLLPYEKEKENARSSVVNSWVHALNTVTGSLELPTHMKNTDTKNFNSYEKIIWENYINSWNTVKSYMGISSKIETTGVGNTKQEKYFVKHGFIPGHGRIGIELSNGLKQTNLRKIENWGDSWKFGPFYGLFFYPISRLAFEIDRDIPAWSGFGGLLSIILLVIVIRTFVFLLTFKGLINQAKMQEVESKKALIDSKYEQYKGNKQMQMRKRQEIQELYSKEGISQLSTFGVALVGMPFFICIWRSIASVEHLKVVEMLGINFSKTAYQELFSGEFQYLPLMIITVLVSLSSQIIPRLFSRKRMKNINVQQRQVIKKSSKNKNIMIVVFSLISLAFSAAVMIYSIVSSLFRIMEASISHKIILKQKKGAKGGSKKFKPSKGKILHSQK
ncbi:MAG: YidC/Oxa1 family membrane protein insertase [Mollicutes bacterium PWAP]|nr:YidC/Oxa1 family membrane protein insertase [Mollicutes bacterium PWAP]